MPDPTRPILPRAILGAAVAAVASAGLLAPPAVAQQRVDTGRVSDANPRAGSGGYNGGGRAYNPGAFGNDVVTGNVTGGREFRGNVPYGDVRSFRGGVGGVGTDNFVRDSAGVTTGGVVTNNASQVRPYYGEQTTVVPPPNFARIPFSGGYVPARPQGGVVGESRIATPGVALGSNDFGAFNSGSNGYDQGYDRGYGNSLGPVQNRAALNGQLPGPVDPQADPNAIGNTGLPNAGLSNVGPGTGLGGDAANGLLDGTGAGGLALGARRATALSPFTLLGADAAGGGDLAEYRRQLVDGQRGGDSNSTDSPTGGRGDALDGGAVRDPQRSADAIDDQLGGRGVGGRAVDDTLGGRRSAAGTRFGPGGLPAPEQQSRLYARLQERLDRFNRAPGQGDSGQPVDPYAPGVTTTPPPGQTDDATATGRPGGLPGLLPGSSGPAGSTDLAGGRSTGPNLDPAANDATPADPSATPSADASADGSAGVGSTPAAPSEPIRAIPSTPLEVKSLAEGTDAAGLRSLLDGAEARVKAGDYADAVDQYDKAERVAPNNPLIPLGRANAELAAGYYRRAEMHLREAFGTAPSLLMGRYDLRGMVGDDRLNTVVRDLRGQAKSDPKSIGALVLLAYVDYNTGNARRAAAYLDLADQRSDRPDPLVAELRQYWDLPGGNDADAAGEAESELGK